MMCYYSYATTTVILLILLLLLVIRKYCILLHDPRLRPDGPFVGHSSTRTLHTAVIVSQCHMIVSQCRMIVSYDSVIVSQCHTVIAAVPSSRSPHVGCPARFTLGNSSRALMGAVVS